jgi:hypothetical protein
MAEEIKKDSVGSFESDIQSYRKNLEYGRSDSELLVAINKAIQESNEFKQQVDKDGERNRKFWKMGSDVDMSARHPKKSKMVVNRIFTDVETAVPIISANTPEPTVIGDVDNSIREKIQKGLEIAYEVKYKMQLKLQCLSRHWYIYKVGVWKYRWDEGFITDNVLPKKIGIDKRATSKDNCEYIWEELEDTAENLIAKFPDKKDVIISFIGKDNLKAKVKYCEFWGGGGEWVCWTIPSRSIILDKKKNPNFDYEDAENNLFQEPQFPYIFLNVFNLGDDTSLYDETSLIEECIPIQEGINQLEQQIIDLNEGQKRVWVASGETMSEKKAQDLVNKTGDLMVYMDRKAPVNGLIQVQSGKPDNSLFTNLTHLLGEIDNVMGIHSTTRGERGQQETLGGRQLLMGSDIGRMDLIVRNVEQAMEEWYNAYLHMIKVYSFEPEILMSAEEKIELSAEDIPNDVIIMVKKGSTLPTDDRTRMEMAKELAASGMIDPKTLYEEMGYGNVEERAVALEEWLVKTGKIIPPQPQMPIQGGMPVENAGGGIEADVANLQNNFNSPEFQRIPDEKKLELLGRGREMLNKIKGAGGGQQV